MANRFKIRRGNNAPSLDDLEDFELGYSIDEKQLYLKVSEEKDGITTKQIVKIPERSTEFKENIVVSSNTKTIQIQNELLKNKVAAIIDVDYTSISDDNYITIFRNLDLVEDSQSVSSNDIIKLRVRGKLPNTSTTIPLKILVIK